MDFSWLALALNDISWVTLAFILGLLASFVRLPPLVGYLVAGFLLQTLGVESGDTIQKLADIGITLLLFTVGLKLNLRSLARPQVWGTTGAHMLLVTAIFTAIFFSLSIFKIPLLDDFNLQQALLLAFALSFSSTVFVVKVLEERGEMNSQHGRIAIGVLIMQDLVAVGFIVATSMSLPSIWAGLLLLLIPLRFVFHRILQACGHGELLILFGLVFALGGAEIFDSVGVKGDLGALIIGVLIANHRKAKELSEAMLGFKDLFLVGFFLSIGLSSELSFTPLLLGLLLVPLVSIKTILFLKLMLALRLRARTSLYASLNLSNYSEFGLIVGALSVANGWLPADWIVTMAIALSGSLILAAPVSNASGGLFQKHRERWRAMQSHNHLPEDRPIDTKGAKLAIFGMGRIGTGAYDEVIQSQSLPVIGIDHDTALVKKHCDEGRNVITGNPADPDFWEKIEGNEKFAMILLALPNLDANLRAIEQIKHVNSDCRIAAVVHYEDEESALKERGIHDVFNIYSAAGTGFAEHVLNDQQQEENQ